MRDAVKRLGVVGTGFIAKGFVLLPLLLLMSTTLPASLSEAAENKRRAMMPCRICSTETFSVLDLGKQPLANALIESPEQPVKTYPLELLVCKKCSAVQLSYCADAD